MKAALLVPVCLAGVALGIVRGPWLAARWRPDHHVVSGARKNRTELVELGPIEEVAERYLYVTEDDYAFEVRGLVTLNRNREVLTNPYAMQALSALDRRRLLQHASGLGKQLTRVELDRSSAARTLSPQTVALVHRAAEATRLTADPSQKEVAVVALIEHVDAMQP